jgi:hypothetical protein
MFLAFKNIFLVAFLVFTHQIVQGTEQQVVAAYERVVIGSGNLVKIERDCPGVHTIYCCFGDFDIDMDAAEEKLIIEGEENIISKLEITIDNGLLRISPQPGLCLIPTCRPSLKGSIGLKNLSNLSLAGPDAQGMYRMFKTRFALEAIDKENFFLEVTGQVRVCAQPDCVLRCCAMMGIKACSGAELCNFSLQAHTLVLELVKDSFMSLDNTFLQELQVTVKERSTLFGLEAEIDDIYINMKETGWAQINAKRYVTGIIEDSFLSMNLSPSLEVELVKNGHSIIEIVKKEELT